jgi:hypothetical protein
MAFCMQQHGGKKDPLIVAANTIPRYLLWAEDLPSGAVTTWTPRFASGVATLTGGLVREDAGYNQRKALYLDGGDHVDLDAILGSFQAGQERTVILALRLVAAASVRCIISDSQSSGSTSTMVRFSLDASDFGTVVKSAATSSPTTVLPEGVPLLLTIRSNGTTVEVKQRKRGVDTTILTETLAETTNVHNQHTLFAHRFQSTVTQYTTGYLRLAVEFATPLPDVNLLAVLDLIESDAVGGYDCPTVEEPEVLLTNELGAAPHILLYTPDLTVGATPTTLPNRGIGPDGSNVSYPAARAPVVSSYSGIPALQLRGVGYADFSTSIDGGWGGYDTAEVILLAFQYGSTNLNNMRFIDYESTAINVSLAPQRVIEVFNNNFRNYHVIGTGSTQEVVTTNTPVKKEARYCLAYSRDGSGNARLLARSRTQSGGFTSVYVTGTQATSVATAITGVFAGGVNRPSSGGQVAFDVGDLVLLSVTRGVSIANQAGLESLLDLIESENGLNLPMGRQINQLDSAPQTGSLALWYSGRLQTTDPTVAIDDWSVAGADGTPVGTLAISADRIDFGSAAGTYILPSPAIAILSGTGQLACVAIVSRKAGLSWTNSDSYNIASVNNTGSCAFYITASNLKILWNVATIDSGYNVLGWAVGEVHIVAFDYDGTNIRFFIDDMTTPYSTVAPGAGRTTTRTLQVGTFNGALGWQGYMHSIQYWVGSALTGAGQMQQAAVSQVMQLIHVYATGDSNSDANVAIAPAGAGVWWYQLRNIVFPLLGYTARFEYNDAVSGSTWNNATPIAPTPIIGRGAALDALATANVLNVLIVGSHSTNDFNYSNLSVAQVQTHITTYCTARIASGKWHKIIFVQTIPQTRNPTNDAKIDTLTAWLLTQVGILFDALVELPSTLQDSTDTVYFIPNSSSAIAEHMNAPGSRELADAIADKCAAMNWSTT